MLGFHGEQECKIDEKGRFRLPAQLFRQLQGEASEVKPFYVNRGMEKCLNLYTSDVWLKITKEINSLNMYVENNRKFARYFYRGATELSLDKNDRLLLPKNLTEYAEIEKDIVLFAYHDRVEIWSKANYEAMLDDEPEDFSTLAETVMGKAFKSE